MTATQLENLNEPMPEALRESLSSLHNTIVQLKSAIDKSAKLVGYIGNDIVIEREDGDRYKYHWSTLVTDSGTKSDTEDAAEEYLLSHEGVDWEDLVRIFEAGAAWAKDKYSIPLQDSDCICQYDHYGGATNPRCIIHGNRRS
jgi:hypothetical protein